MGEVTISSIVSDIGTVFTGAIGWVGDVATAITANPLLLLGCTVGFIGLGVGLFRRIFHV